MSVQKTKKQKTTKEDKIKEASKLSASKLKKKKEEEKKQLHERIENKPIENLITTEKINKQGQDTLDSPEMSVEKKLIALYMLQTVDSELDKIKIVRGELPLEVQDLEDEVVRFDTRLKNIANEMKEIKDLIAQKKKQIKDSTALIAKYQKQINEVRNNREYESLNKEIEFQGLEIQLAEKKIKEYDELYKEKEKAIEEQKNKLEETKEYLNQKKKELEDIMLETEKEEIKLLEKSRIYQENVEERLLNAYKKLRNNMRNGLAVVPIERDACGGCFNKIPPQRKLEVSMRKKIIVCEYCGRILIDEKLAGEVVNINNN